MKRIEFKGVLPDIFSRNDGIKSDVWRGDALFEKGRLYLVEADSGRDCVLKNLW